ncbi:hypothetical protein RUND412_010429, partial [Rhizina undulata]
MVEGKRQQRKRAAEIDVTEMAHIKKSKLQSGLQDAKARYLMKSCVTILLGRRKLMTIDASLSFNKFIELWDIYNNTQGKFFWYKTTSGGEHIFDNEKTFQRFNEERGKHLIKFESNGAILINRLTAE